MYFQVPLFLYHQQVMKLEAILVVARRSLRSTRPKRCGRSTRSKRNIRIIKEFWRRWIAGLISSFVLRCDQLRLTSHIFFPDNHCPLSDQMPLSIRLADLSRRAGLISSFVLRCDQLRLTSHIFFPEHNHCPCSRIKCGAEKVELGYKTNPHAN